MKQEQATSRWQLPTRRAVLVALRGTVYALTGLLGLALLAIGTVAIIAEIKGTWHWSIHLESTISYGGILISYLLLVLIPLFGIFVVVRWRWNDV
ncbi:hypothetical protein [Haladaptatus sp. NG-SE-30]